MFKAHMILPYKQGNQGIISRIVYFMDPQTSLELQGMLNYNKFTINT